MLGGKNTLRTQKNPKPLYELVSLHGKNALITSSASGIGKAVAYRFAEAGADLELVDVNKEKLENACDELSKLGVSIRIHKVDLSKKVEIDQLWEMLKGKEPDILVNNAGTYPLKDFLELDEAFLQKIMDINLNSALWMCQHMIKNRLKRGGVIINVGSVEAVMPFKEGLVHYDMSKAGVIVLTRALAAEYGRHGFRISALIPGGVVTPGTKSLAKEALKLNIDVIQSGLEYKQRLPVGRFGQPDEIARMALVLACDLSSYVHGAPVAVDGGFLSAQQHSRSVSYHAIRARFHRKHIQMRIKELRSYYASFMVKHGIISEEVDLLQGRVSKSVFVRHYLKENPIDLRDRTLEALRQLENTPGL